ncbi:NfeD family protein [Alkalitalea saponilacus]|uniref:Membrane-bound serine protease (ClpP class) n=1 Tax=Alkalitalea saponilacus TaxID=889453 RepID=A0A1T5HTW0_9BACT|nr:NfeD family protein [Alkalitalea saponilacus]ASB50248.1 serine protease [Alkalitalea saponilacus]SKC24109.1 membrane-bound serine protease (ClpP class) [Alkalitalea saponilacus]
MKKLTGFLMILLALISISANETAETGKPLVYRLPIFSNINSTVWVHTQKAFKEAREMNADMILIHMNTYGGEVVFADSIRTKILNSDIPVHVFIDNNAASAGALISIAAQNIYMRPGANIGAATVVNQTGEEMPDKFQSYMRSTIRATAESHGKDTIIVANDTIVKWRRDPRIAEAMVDERVEIPGIIEAGQVLTFTALEAVEHGFCDGIARSIDDVLEQLGVPDAEVVSFRPTFYDNLKGFLTSPILRGMLILVILGGIYFELQSPGIGFPIIAAIVAAVLYFAPLYLDGLAANWEIMLFVIGVVLIALEIFVIPGFGVAGISGTILVVTGLVLSLLDNVVFDFSGVKTKELMEALLTVFGGMFGGILLVIYLSNRWTASPTAPLSRITLQTSQDINQGYVSVDTHYKSLVGKTGVSSTVLRPSGKVTIEGEVYDARALEGFVDRDENIKVISFTSGQLNVRKI